jgi:hypothetical protein
MTILRSLAVLSFLVGATSVVAQTTATPTTAAAPEAATTTCVKPGHYPGKKASDNVKEKWINEVRLWGDCVRASVADLRAQIDAKIKLANSTIEDYNAGVKELQEEQKVAETGSK